MGNVGSNVLAASPVGLIGTKSLDMSASAASLLILFKCYVKYYIVLVSL